MYTASMWWAIAHFILSVADVVCTMLAVKSGFGRERNPVVRRMLDRLGRAATAAILMVVNTGVSLLMWTVYDWSVVLRVELIALVIMRIGIMVLHARWIREVIRAR